MRTFIRILGWCLLVTGMVGTASNLAFVAFGGWDRLGFLVFGIAIVLVGLWMAGPIVPKSVVERTRSSRSTSRPSLSDQGERADENTSSEEAQQHTAPRSFEIIKCPHCATRVVPMADGVCPSCRRPI